MVKIVYCISRKPDVSDAEFHRYWKEVHGPIAARIPGVRRYVQSHALARSREIRPADYDGVAELWFDDMDALLAAVGSPAALAAIEDERNFIDHSRTAFFVAEEHQIV
jgi:uncharacterized protein (TIGR02118 family)